MRWTLDKANWVPVLAGITELRFRQGNLLSQWLIPLRYKKVTYDLFEKPEKLLNEKWIVKQNYDYKKLGGYFGLERKPNKETIRTCLFGRVWTESLRKSIMRKYEFWQPIKDSRIPSKNKRPYKYRTGFSLQLGLRWVFFQMQITLISF